MSLNKTHEEIVELTAGSASLAYTVNGDCFASDLSLVEQVIEKETLALIR
ncbi:MAG: hypothetical protein ACK5LZ_04430 [Anaerorhabdus sp.]